MTAFGKPVNTVYHLDKADVIVSLDADFLASGAGHVRYAREFSARRSMECPSSNPNRLYVVESMPTNTGAMADHRGPLTPSGIYRYCHELAASVGVAVPNWLAGSFLSSGHARSQKICRSIVERRW